MGRKMQNEAEWLGERELTLQEEAPWKAENQGRALWVGRSVGCAAETASYHADRVCGDPTKDAHDVMRDLYFTLQSKGSTEWLLAHI